MQPPGRLFVVFLCEQNLKSSVLSVFREREQQSMNHFNLNAASKLKFLIFYVHTASSKIK